MRGCRASPDVGRYALSTDSTVEKRSGPSCSEGVEESGMPWARAGARHTQLRRECSESICEKRKGSKIELFKAILKSDEAPTLLKLNLAVTESRDVAPDKFEQFGERLTIMRCRAMGQGIGPHNETVLE